MNFNPAGWRGNNPQGDISVVDSGFSPLDISDLIAWFDANVGITLNGADVSLWEDQSGNGNDLIQGTAADQPVFNASDADFDGKPSVGILSGERLRTAAFASALSQPNTIFIVLKKNATNTGHAYDGIISSSQQSFARENQMRGGATLSLSGSIGTAKALLTNIFNGVTSESWNAGTSMGSGDAGAHTMTGLTLGSRYDGASSVDGQVPEFLIYGKELSVPEHNQVGNYLADKFDFTWVTVS